MNDFLSLAFLLVIILVAAKLAGFFSSRLGQPAVLGEILVGILLGPSVLDLVHLPILNNSHLGEVITELGELGVLLLMFIAGLELHLNDLARNSRVSVLGGSLGVVFPLVFGLATGLLFKAEWQTAIFLGLAMGATSVSISVQTLIELKALRSRVGLGLLGAAVFDDILVILFLSIFLALSSSEAGLSGILVVIIKMALLVGLSIGFGKWFLPALIHQVNRMQMSQGVLTLALVVLLVYGLAAELLGGMAAITGTFIAGMMFARTPHKENIESGLHSLAYSFFVPIFFISIGINVNLRNVQTTAILLMIAISLAAVLGKIIGAGLGARLAKFSAVESLQLGIGMVSRGEVGLILANLGLNAGLLNITAQSSKDLVA